MPSAYREKLIGVAESISSYPKNVIFDALNIYRFLVLEKDRNKVVKKSGAEIGKEIGFHRNRIYRAMVVLVAIGLVEYIQPNVKGRFDKAYFKVI